MIEAVVQAGSFETPYRRAGCGAPVLLLAAGAGEADGEWLFEQLAGRFRVIAPALPAGLGRDDGEAAETLGLWLTGLIDGLGLERAAVVDSTDHGPALLRFVALDPYRLDRLALIHGGDRGEAVASELADAIRAARHPVLLAALPPAEDAQVRAEVLAELIEFLGGGVEPPQALLANRKPS